ncbi:tumor necrosis factor ligand superfamily member 10-like [Nothoprocta perdicaria]|uniref:tumor necrosis factor ligand superfamily member 10-like n=1 Tax=Nothoprocta perdicaria TaxID=30464 RepID=UPI000E1C3BD2|nr:tumor necrosis factor ligand superfamily member 10-like [Nothoprocta perdicaria]
MVPQQPRAGHCLRSHSGASAAPMLPSPGGGPDDPRRRRCGPLWGSVAVMAIVALQIASTTGLFVYFTMAISKLKAQSQGSSEELRCLQLINQQQEGSDLEELISNQSCLKLAKTIKAYVTTVTEKVVRRSTVREAQMSYLNTSEGQVLPKAPSKPSAHLTLRPQSLAQDGSSKRFGNLSQSCRHAIARWEDSTIHSHLQNITYRDGRLRVNQAGKYYVYSQIYFRYPSDGASARISVPQLVQCINWKTSYSQPILLLKGVGTKCWAPEANYGLHALYQGGLFELKVGDELFVSVSSLAIDYNDAAASYFGAFRLDL